MSTPSAPVFVSMVLTSLANCWMLESDLETVLNPMSSPHPPTAVLVSTKMLDGSETAYQSKLSHWDILIGWLRLEYRASRLQGCSRRLAALAVADRVQGEQLPNARMT